MVSLKTILLLPCSIWNFINSFNPFRSGAREVEIALPDPLPFGAQIVPIVLYVVDVLRASVRKIFNGDPWLMSAFALYIFITVLCYLTLMNYFRLNKHLRKCIEEFELACHGESAYETVVTEQKRLRNTVNQQSAVAQVLEKEIDTVKLVLEETRDKLSCLESCLEGEVRHLLHYHPSSSPSLPDASGDSVIASGGSSELVQGLQSIVGTEDSLIAV